MTKRRTATVPDIGSRDRLRLAALAVFSERGFHGATTREIAALAEMSPAAVYLHYRSKAELLETVIVEAHDVLIAALDAGTSAPAASPLDTLRQLVQAHVTYHASHQAMARVANHELPALEHAARARVLSMRRQIEDRFQLAIENCVAADLCTVENVRLAVFGILSIGIGVARWFKPEGSYTPQRLGRLYSGMAVHMLTAEESFDQPASMSEASRGT